MTAITAALVKELREKSGAGMMDCKKALQENDGDIEAAMEWLRKKGIAKADKKSGRTAAEGLIGVCRDWHASSQYFGPLVATGWTSWSTSIAYHPYRDTPCGILPGD